MIRTQFKSLICVALLAALLPAIEAKAQSTATFAGPGSTGTTLSSYISPGVTNGGIPRLQFINATSDKAASILQFYSTTVSSRVTNTTASGQAVIQAPGGSFTGSDIIVVRSVANDTYQRLIVSSSAAGTITATANLNFALASGDIVYKMTANGSVPVGAATLTLNAVGGGLYNGQSLRPFLIDLDGTSACKINIASGIWQQ